MDQRHVDWQNEAHFFGVAAQVMRRVLVDHARRRGAIKRGGGAQLVSIDEASGVASGELPALAFDAALDRLEKARSPTGKTGGVFDRIGTAPSRKRHVGFDAGHMMFPRGPLTQEIATWLDRHLGRPASASNRP